MIGVTTIVKPAMLLMEKPGVVSVTINISQEMAFAQKINAAGPVLIRKIPIMAKNNATNNPIGFLHSVEF